MIIGCVGLFDDWYPKQTDDSDPNPDPKTAFRKQKENVFLFNLNDDPLEIKNLAIEFPEKVYELEKKLECLKKDVVKPLNPPSLKPDRNADPTKWYFFESNIFLPIKLIFD